MIEHGDYMCHPQPCDRYIHGTVVEYYCYPGYSLANDYKYITCQYGQWFPQMQFYCIKDGKLACISFNKTLQTFLFGTSQSDEPYKLAQGMCNEK